ncbi:biotin--[acetyl-CoA-carboxylase] ligase [Methanobacterium sp. CWC-01]|uniref:biotin--[acetyl-CoA-carboxylase] ligase n=1 Tax=Methanobacterium aridiramus TaxID=2584467 RepID=UPI002577524D|nr:biotin--[acetyl-CoA-carboxylase] ligase [Methanobacterium sp. CWC-01]WJI10215.1 biotin--[acetyl-CoA-carboxylase] ligase [Methanobacterium sp. CWC-01]
MVKKKILRSLNQVRGEYREEEELASQAGITADELREEIQDLIGDGFVIESSNEGYRLVKIPNRLLPYQIQEDLHTSYIGHDIRYFSEVDSTNEVAKKLAEEGASQGTIVIAEVQRRGKGRLGKRWLSPEGGVWMTIILRPDIALVKAPLLTLVTGVAVAETLQSRCGLDVGIKWPNDILIGEKKVCGILTEVSENKGALDYVVLGIGIDLNVDVEDFPRDLKEGATSLKNELDQEIYGVEVVQRFLENFEAIYEEFEKGQFPAILAQWRRLSKTIGRQVEVHKKGHMVVGEAVGINRDGALILEEEDGTLIKVISGECVHRPL